MRNVETNCNSPKTKATLMTPTICLLMKSRAHAEQTTYSRYHDRNAAVIGNEKRRKLERSSRKSALSRRALYLAAVPATPRPPALVAPPRPFDLVMSRLLPSLEALRLLPITGRIGPYHPVWKPATRHEGV